MSNFKQYHLQRPNGSGFATKTACGRHHTRAPISMTWAEFKEQDASKQCQGCLKSTVYALLARNDAKAAAEAQAIAAELDSAAQYLNAPARQLQIAKEDLVDAGWIPESDDDWRVRDAALIARAKAKGLKTRFIK